MVVTCGIDNRVITTHETSTHRRRNGGVVTEGMCPTKFYAKVQCPHKILQLQAHDSGVCNRLRSNVV